MSKIILTNYGKTIEEKVKDRTKLQKFLRHIENYFDKNSDIIFDQGPSKNLIFANKDKEALYDFLDVDPKEVAKVIKTIPTIQSTWRLLNDPFIVLGVYIVRELVIQKKERERDLVLMYLSMKSYSSKQKVFMKYGANEQIMAYTINHLSDRYKYKALKNNYNVMKDVVLTSHNSYEKLLLKGDDELLNTYYPQIHSRIARVLRNVANEYYINREQKKYLNTLNTYDDEKGGNLDYESSASIMDDLASGACTFFISNMVSSKLARMVATKNDVPYVTVYQCLMEMRKQEKPDTILRFFKAIIEIIYEADKNILGRVCSKDFSIIALRQLSVSNSRNESLALIKSELDRILTTYCGKYAATERLATKMAYRNAIYSYMVYILIVSKCVTYSYL